MYELLGISLFFLTFFLSGFGFWFRHCFFTAFFGAFFAAFFADFLFAGLAGLEVFLVRWFCFCRLRFRSFWFW